MNNIEKNHKAMVFVGGRLLHTREKLAKVENEPVYWENRVSFYREEVEMLEYLNQLVKEAQHV